MEDRRQRKSGKGREKVYILRTHPRGPMVPNKPHLWKFTSPPKMQLNHDSISGVINWLGHSPHNSITYEWLALAAREQTFNTWVSRGEETSYPNHPKQTIILILHEYLPAWNILTFWFHFFFVRNPNLTGHLFFPHGNTTKF
jgi:hypothetical protein